MTARVKKSVSQYLKPVASRLFRARIRALFATSCRANGSEATKTPWKGFNDAKRSVLADAIFAVEDARETSHGPHDDAVTQMRAARNAVYTDLGWTEEPVRASV